MNAPRIAYVLPTRDRPDRLRRTLAALGALPQHDACIIIVDNNSNQAINVDALLSNQINVEIVRLKENAGAAARNASVAAADPSCEWVIMLDDDSHPTDLGHLPALREASSDTAAVSAEIRLPAAGCRESGGLPEVFIGCGVAIRRSLFQELGGYDPTFHYYAEEYDLAARMLLNGYRVVLDRRFKLDHHKVATGRDMNLILRRLVRNNGWVARRYAPKDELAGMMNECVARYAGIARRERALRGYAWGLWELMMTLRSQPRRPMPQLLHDRFTGLAAARESLQAAFAMAPFRSAHLVARGKNSRRIEAAIAELGVRMVRHADDAEILVLGTLSPGPLLDAAEAAAMDTSRRVVSPWMALTGATVTNREEPTCGVPITRRVATSASAA